MATPVEPLLDADNTELSVTGAFYGGLITVTPPVDGTSVLTGYDCYGYTSEDGIEETPTRSVDKLKGWQNNAVVQNAVTEAGVSYSVTFIETTKAVVELWHGATLDEATGKLTFDPGFTSAKQRFVVDIIDGDQVERHSFVGQVGELDARTFASGELRGYPMTIEVVGTVEKWFTKLIVPVIP